MSDFIKFLEKCAVNGEPFKLKPYQKRLMKMIEEKKINPQSRGASRCSFNTPHESTITVTTAGAEDPPSQGDRTVVLYSTPDKFTTMWQKLDVEPFRPFWFVWHDLIIDYYLWRDKELELLAALLVDDSEWEWFQ